jgi:hypothetical protein
VLMGGVTVPSRLLPQYLLMHGERGEWLGYTLFLRVGRLAPAFVVTNCSGGGHQSGAVLPTCFLLADHHLVVLLITCCQHVRNTTVVDCYACTILCGGADDGLGCLLLPLDTLVPCSLIRAHAEGICMP